MNAAQPLASPRWPGGPPICEEYNLPAFESRQALKTWMEQNAPGVHVERTGKCKACGLWHAATTARGPAGESSGCGRYTKNKT